MKLFGGSAACVSSLLALACSDATGTRVGVVQIAEQNVTLSVGDSTRLSLLFMLPPGYVPTNVLWSSPDGTTLKVHQLSSGMAVVTGLRVGRALVHADAGKIGDSTEVIVR
jgi:hypothetical protein